MLVFRSFVLGLTGACFLLLATHHTEIHVVESDHVVHDECEAPTGASIIDVAAGIDPARVPSLLQLGSDHVIAVDGTPVVNDLEAGELLAQRAARSNQFIDLTVEGSTGARRVLVLLH